jgi:hypothetical protein
VSVSRVLYLVGSCISVPLRWMLLNGLVLMSPKNVLDGIKVVDAAGEHSDQTIRSLHAALQVISQTDPRRFERLRRDLRRIVLVKAGNPEFASEAGACLIRGGYVRQNSPEAVATTIVHEAVHARLHRRGIGYGPTMRSRVEEVCVREQIAFAGRLRNAEIVSHLRQRLDGPLWAPAQRHEDRMAALRSLRIPEWMLRIYEGLARVVGRHP